MLQGISFYANMPKLSSPPTGRGSFPVRKTQFHELKANQTQFHELKANQTQFHEQSE
jgi:hypothetical protein